MKNVYLSLLIAIFAMSFYSCSSDDYILQEESSSDFLEINSLKNESQIAFIKEFSNICDEYNNTTSRVSQEDVANASRWILNAAADGLGGAPFGPLGWLTGAAASSLYAMYLDNILEEASRSVPSAYYKDVAYNADYLRTNKKVEFVFCGNDPKNTQDSIGFRHNQILNHFMTNHRNRYISNGGELNSVYFYSEYNKSLKSLGYDNINIDKIFDDDVTDFLQTLAQSLANLRVDKGKDKDVFNNIEFALHKSAKISKHDAKFLTLILKISITSFNEGIPLEKIDLFSCKINKALDNSKLSEVDISMCKNYFQTMLCSYIYWMSQKTY